jgi:hypothetical protein
MAAERRVSTSIQLHSQYVLINFSPTAKPY